MRACMLSYSFYEMDNRVRRYAETLVQHGYQVDAFALRQQGEPEHRVIQGVNVYGIQERVRNEKTKLHYLYRLLQFFVTSFLVLTRRHLSKPYDLVHVHSVPDFEVFAALIPKLTGATIILDIHDIVPEFYASKFGVPQSSWIFKSLILMEKLSAAFANHVIAANHIWEKRLRQRSVKPKKLTTMLNFPDTKLFRKSGRTRADGRFVILYPGSLNQHQGLDLAIRAFARISNACPEAEFHIYGSGESLPSLTARAAELNVSDRVIIRPPVPLDRIGSIMENADLGLVPKRKNGFGDEAFSTKILEFMTMGVPVLIADTTIDKFYFDPTLVRFFESGNEESLAANLLDLIRNPEERLAMARRAGIFVEQYSWGANENRYLEIVDQFRSAPTGAPRSKDSSLVNAGRPDRS